MPAEKEILQSIFDHIPVMISFFDATGRLMYVNREWEQALGWTLEEARSRDIVADTYPDGADRAAAREFLRRAEGRWGRFQPTTKDGRRLETTWMRVQLSDGSRIGFGLDVTDRMRAETALAESQRRFASVFQSAPVALGMSTIAEGRIIDVNERWSEILGYAKEEVVGRRNSELNLSVDQGLRQTLVEQVRAHGVLRDVAIQVRAKSGDMRDLLVSMVSIDAGSDEAIWISSMLDTTDTKRVQAERDRLLASEQAARAAAEAALERLRIIQRITEPTLSFLRFDQRLSELLVRLSETLGGDWATVLFPDANETLLVQQAVHGIDLPGRRASYDSPFGKVFFAGQAAIITRQELMGGTGNSSWVRDAGLRSAMLAPLVVEGRATGVLAVGSMRETAFDEEKLKILEMVALRVAPTVERARLVRVARAAHERLAMVSRRLLNAQERERQRIAVELHDDLGQVLTAVKIHLETLQRAATGPMNRELTGAVERVDEAMQRVRELALDLRPSALDDLGLAAALRGLIDRFARKMPFETHVSIDELPKLDPTIENTYFRLAQEALTNVARHARASNVWFDLHVLDDVVELSVRDDGVGFDASVARARAVSGQSIGLLGMEERAALAGAQFDIVTRPTGGTRLQVRFPLSDRAR
jgi:PAS domain S-box-containing protein